MSLILFKQIVGLFIIMGCGCLLVKLKLLKSDDSRALSVICLYLVQPCVIIRAFQIDFTPDVMQSFLVAVGAALLLHACLLAISWVYGRAFNLAPVERASIIYSNAGNLVIPLVTAILGDQWVIYASAFICVQQCFIWTHGLSLISGARKANVKKILLNCNLISIALSVIMLIFRIRLPELILNTMGSLAGMIGPIAMLMVGMLLASADIKSMLKNRRLYMIALLKMVVTPLIMLLVLKLSHLSALAPAGETLIYVSFLAVMTPAASTVTQLSLLHKNQPEYASAINVMTTLLAIGTMPLMTALFYL